MLSDGSEDTAEARGGGRTGRVSSLGDFWGLGDTGVAAHSGACDTSDIMPPAGIGGLDWAKGSGPDGGRQA